MRVIKTTLIGGAIFLVPVIVILFVLGKAISVMRHVTRPISEMLPFETLPAWRSPTCWRCWVWRWSVSALACWRAAPAPDACISSSTTAC